MLYQSSQSTGDGRVTITVTFKLGTDLDTAQVLVQNRVALAEPSLPEEVRRQGVVVRKEQPSWLMAVNVLSPDGSLDRGYVSNYALTQIRDRLTRVDGIGDVQIFGAATMRCASGSIPAALDARPDRRRGGQGAALAERPGRRRRRRPAAYDTGAAQQLNVETRAASRPPTSSATSSSAPTRDRRDQPAARRGPGRARRRRLWRQRLSVGHRLDHPRHHPAAGHQRARRRRRRQGRAGGCRQELPQGARVPDHLEPDRVHQSR